MPALLDNYLDKHEAVNRTAEALVRDGHRRWWPPRCCTEEGFSTCP